MKISYYTLQDYLKKSQNSLVYFIIGGEQILMQNAVVQIKKAYANFEIKKLQLEVINDWNNLLTEANHYSLFSQNTLLHAQLDKKTIEEKAKNKLIQYLGNPNPRCIIIIEAPELPTKQWSIFVNQSKIVIVQAYPPNQKEFLAYIASEFQRLNIKHDSNILKNIYNLTEGNLIACSQLIQKIALIYNNSEINLDLVDFVDETKYQLSALSDAYLIGDAKKVIQIFKRLQEEPTWILWLIVQDIRSLIALKLKATNFKTQNIWPQRMSLYQAAAKRIDLNYLYLLLQASAQIDERLKTKNNLSPKNDLERLALSLCGNLFVC